MPAHLILLTHLKVMLLSSVQRGGLGLNVEWGPKAHPCCNSWLGGGGSRDEGTKTCVVDIGAVCLSFPALPHFQAPGGTVPLAPKVGWSQWAVEWQSCITSRSEHLIDGVNEWGDVTPSSQVPNWDAYSGQNPQRASALPQLEQEIYFCCHKSPRLWSYLLP